MKKLLLIIAGLGIGYYLLTQRLGLTTEHLTAEFCRGLVSDDENDQAATNAAFEVLHFIAGKRLAAGRLTSKP